MKFYRKIVAIVTTFVGGSAGVFLVSGAGAAGLRLLVWLVFVICLLNVSIYIREFFQWFQKTIQSAGAHLAATGKPAAGGKPGGDAKTGGEGKPAGGGDNNNNNKPGGDGKPSGDGDQKQH